MSRLKRMAHAPQGTFFRGNRFFLTFYARLLVMFSFTQFGEDAGFFA